MDPKRIEKLGEIGRETADRREFLKKAGKLAATVPAVALLLSANATPAEAYNRYGRGGSGGRSNHDYRGGENGQKQHGHGHGYSRRHGHDKD